MIKIKIFGYKKEQLEQIAVNMIGSHKIKCDIDEFMLDSKVILTNEGEDEDTYNSLLADFMRETKYNLYGEDDDTLSKKAIDYLLLHNKKLSVAESLTGGMISNSIIDNAGASEVLFEALVTYSNESKIKRLGVSRFTLESNGAVSYECAYEMANGLLKILDTDIALSTTGIAGPSGGTDDKPVGLTYICVADRQAFKVYNHCFEGDRNSIRIQAANTALFYLINKLKNG